MSIVSYTIMYIFFAYRVGLSVFKKYALIFAVPIFETFISLFNNGTESFSAYLYGLLQFFIWSFVCEYITNNKKNRSLKSVYVLLCVTILVTTITTYYGCLLMPGASRQMATGMNDDRELMAVFANLNIGGFGFVYTLVLLLPFLFYTIRYLTDNLLKKIIIIIATGIVSLTIYTTEYSTAILFALLSVSILFLPKQLKLQNITFVIAGVTIVGVILSSILPSFFSAFSSATESYNISIRMEELGNMMSGSSTSGDVQGRIDLWYLSLYNFIHNPIFGTGNGGGGHSYILDTLSKFGIWGLALVIIQFKAIYNLFVKPYLRTNYSTLFVFVYMVNFLFCIVNTYCYFNIFLLFMPLFIVFHEKTNSDTVFILK